MVNGNNCRSGADIIIPAYNAEKTIARTLDSLCYQSCRTFKVIVVNDASTDQTARIVKSYFGKLDIKLINLKNNAGVSNARNVGIENSSSKYILFIDSDDAVDKQYVEHLLSVEETAEYVVIQYHLSTEKKILKMDIGETTVENFKNNCWNLWTKFRVTNVWGVRYRRDIIKSNKLNFDINLKWGEDTEFNFRYLHKCKKMVSLPYSEYIYFRTVGSATQKYEQSRYMNALKVAKTIAEFAPHSNQLWMIKYIYWDMAVRHCMNHLNDHRDREWKRKVNSDMKKILKDPFFRTCLKDVIHKGSVDMKVYAFFLKIKILWPYVIIAKKLKWIP